MSAILREFQANRPALRRLLARYIRSRDEVEDLLQEVFLRAFAAEARGPILLPRAYLFRTAKHIALNELAKSRNRRTQAMEDFDDPDVVGSDSQPGVEQIVEGRRQMALLSRAVASLPDQCRRVVVLKKVEGLSQREIARKLGIAESTVEKHLAKGLLLTRDYMARWNAASSEAALTASVDDRLVRRRLGDGE